MASPKCLTAQQHLNIIDAIRAYAASRHIYRPAGIAALLGTSPINWRRWVNGQSMRRATAAALCAAIGLHRPSVLSKHLQAAPSEIGRLRKAAHLAETAWHLHTTAVRTGAELLVWLSRQRIDATLMAGIGLRPVVLSWQAECGDELYYDIVVEPTPELWTALFHRIGATQIPLVEGPLSDELLLCMMRHVRIYLNQFSKTNAI